MFAALPLALFPLFLPLQAVATARAAPAAERAAPPAIERAAPKDALFLVHVRDLERLRAAWAKNAWSRLWADEELAGVRGWIDEKLAEMEEDADGAEIDPFEVIGAIHGSTAFFGVATEGSTTPALAVAVDPGEPRGPFEDLYDRMLEQSSEGTIASTETYGGVELRLFEDEHAIDEQDPEDGDEEQGDPDGDSDDHPFAASFDTGTWVGFAGAPTREALLDLVHGMIDRVGGKDPSNGFAGSEMFLEARRSVAAPGRIEVGVDLARAIALAREAEKDGDEDPEDDRMLEALGIGGLRWAYACADVGEGEQLSFDASLRLPDAGFLRTIAECLGSLPREMAGKVPKESTAISLGRFDVAKLYGAIWDLVAEFEGKDKDSRAQFDAALEGIGATDFDTSLVAQLDGRFASFSCAVPEDEWRAGLGLLGAQAPKPAAPLGQALVIGLRDSGVVSAFVGKLLASVARGQKVETEDFQGVPIHTFAPAPGTRFDWAFPQGALVFSSYPTALRAALRMQGAEASASALENPRFKPLFESHAGASILALASTAESLKAGLTMMQTLGALAGGIGAGALGELPELPAPESIDRHLKGTIVTSVTRSGSALRVHYGSR